MMEMFDKQAERHRIQQEEAISAIMGLSEQKENLDELASLDNERADKAEQESAEVVAEHQELE